MVDTVPPVVNITSPAAGTIRGTVSIEATASDAASGLASLTVSVDGLIAPAASGLSWNTNAIGVSGQTYIVRAHATDNAGNTADSTVTVLVDNTPPAAPTDVHPFQSPTTGSPILLWTAVPGVTYHVARTSSTGPGPRNFTDAAAPGWQDPDTLPPGTYTYVVTAADLVGNSAARRRRP